METRNKCAHSWSLALQCAVTFLLSQLSNVGSACGHSILISGQFKQ